MYGISESHLMIQMLSDVCKKENLWISNCTSFVTIFADAKNNSIFLEALTH